MVVDLVQVVDGTNDLSTDRPPLAETLQLAPCSAVRTLNESGLGGVGVVYSIGIHPLLDFYAAGTIVETVCCICSLSRDVTYLADKSELRIISS